MVPRRFVVNANCEARMAKREWRSTNGEARRHPERAKRVEGSLRRIAMLIPLIALGGCSWFTDFKQQPKIDPWETANDTIPFRGNPQMSVPINGSAAPGFLYDRVPSPQVIATMANIPNPVPADSAS